MAKSVKARATKKTGNRRMKRTIRRTIGALCMISAITIAAIPVPENEAYSPTANPIKEYSTLGITTAAAGNNLTMPSGLTKNGITYTLNQNGNVTYLDRQFNYASTDNYTNAYITGYNDQMTSSIVDLRNNMLFTDYVYIELDSFTDLTERTTDSTKKDITVDVYLGENNPNNPWQRSVEKLGYGYTLTGDPDTWNTSADYYTFFYNNFKAELDKYKSDYQTYKEDTTGTVVIPSDVTRCLLDHEKYDTVEEQRAYLCDKIFGNGSEYGINLVATTMFTYDSNNVQGSKQIYLFKANGAEKESDLDRLQTAGGRLLHTDSQKFICMEFINLVGIKEGALQGVNRIEEMYLGNDIVNICDRAFYNSSMLKKVEFGTGTKIGNQAFCYSLNLDTVNLEGVYEIGKEAFAHTKIGDITIPESVTKIEDGAFYACASLRNIQFTGKGNSQNGDTIGIGAFCDCGMLNSVHFTSQNSSTGETEERKIGSIGDYAFAITDSSLVNKDALAEFNYPDSITVGTKLGNFALANRNNLKKVKVSSGLLASEVVPETLVAKCANLEYFRFPKECGGVKYEPTMFYDVVNPDFYVWGPEKFSGDYAIPRKTTWQARMNVAASSGGTGDPVTYKYYKGDDETNPVTYEISNGILIQGIDANGQLVNCTYVPGKEAETELVIPGSVAGIQLTSIAKDCFNEDLRCKDKTGSFGVTKIVIEDGNLINRIDGAKDSVDIENRDKIVSAFRDFDKVEEVILGNGVNEIGVGAFYDCDSLKKVTIGENVTKIEDWAFNECPLLTEIHFDNPTSEDTLGFIGEDALSTGSDKLTIYGIIGSKYKPFIWSMDNNNYVDSSKGIRVCYKTNAPSCYTVILDNKNGLPTLVDYPHYEDIDPAILGKTTLTNDEQDLINATKNIIIPEGIKSIDVKGYLNSNSKSDTKSANGTSYDNKMNIQTYLNPNTATDAFGQAAGSKYYDTYKEFGLFNGYFGNNNEIYEYGDADEYYLGLLGVTKHPGESDSLPFEKTGTNKEKNPIGNDYVEVISLSDVEYLPDLAFYNCENLQLLSLGDDMEDVGNLPVADCTSLSSIGSGVNKYVAENGILYENKTNGNKKIIEVFSGRGEAAGSRTVNNANDPYINDVDEIAQGAFSDCDIITFVELDGIKADTIPKYCFYDCDNLREVDLPNEVSEDIEDYAFGKDPGLHVKLESKKVYLSPDAFGDITTAESPIVELYKDAEAEKPSQRLGANKVKAELKYIGEKFDVIFWTADITEIIDKQEVEDGGSAVEPDWKNDEIVYEQIMSGCPEGYYYDGGWSKSLRGIHANTDVVPTYVKSANASPGSPSGAVDPTSAAATSAASATNAANGTPSGSGSSSTKYPLTVVYGSGSGQYPEGTKVIIEAIDAPEGKVFDKWVVTGAAATVYSSTSKATTVTTAAGETIITATYKNAGTNTGGSGSGSGGSGTKTSTGTHNRTGADGSPAAGTGSSTRVDITKPGISDVDKAYASVSGSTDSFVVKITESADAANAVATALANKYGDMTPIKYFAMDISLYDATGTNKITDTTGLKVNVTMPIPDALRQYAGNNKVGAVVNGTQLEDLACKFTTVDGIPCISFTATHFSPYTIYVDTNNLQVGLMDSSPKTGDPIHPKWFVTIALAATSLFLFLKRDKVAIPVKA